jgi:thiol-disulfide isomerase/thioredoxin
MRIFLCNLLFLVSGVGYLFAQAPVVRAVIPLDEAGLQQRLTASRGKVVVLNFWATWCKPCIEEFPDLLKLRAEYADKGMHLVFVTIDEPKKAEREVRTFLRKMGVNFETYIKKVKDDEAFINSVDSKWSGAIPATFIYNKQGKLIHSLVDEQTFADLSTLVIPLLAE